MLCGQMPYDDSNIDRMIKEQLEGKIRYPSRSYSTLNDPALINSSSHFFIDPLAKELMSQMMQPDVERRAKIDKVLAHSWLN